MKEEDPGLHPGAHHQTLIGSEHHHGADVRDFTDDRRQDGSGEDRIDAVELTRRLGFTAGEYTSGGQRETRVGVARTLKAAQKLAERVQNEMTDDKRVAQ